MVIASGFTAVPLAVVAAMASICFSLLHSSSGHPALIDRKFNATQHTTATGGAGSQSKVLEREEPLDLPGDTRRCDPVQHQIVGDTGFEPVTSAV